MKTLVIGYGNTLRGDDGVGPVVTQQIALWALPHVQTRAVHQLTPELSEEIAQAEVVCFVDAWIQPSDKAPAFGKIEQLYPQSLETQLNHAWSPRLLLYLAKSLYGRVPTAYHLLIPAMQFDYGEVLSPLAIRGVDWAIQMIKTLVGQERPCHA